jgi:tight adherence protein C
VPTTHGTVIAFALALSWAALILVAAARVRRRPVRLAFAPRPDDVTTAASGRRAERRQRVQIADALPDVIDLFAVAVAAGLNTRLAVRAVAERAPTGPLSRALADVETQVDTTGCRLADALERLPERLGVEAARPLITALTDADRYGAALGPTLDRLADDARRSRQRRAEEAARRVPVKLLFPLVTCILPAFGLLTVAPLIAGGLRALGL